MTSSGFSCCETSPDSICRGSGNISGYSHKMRDRLLKLRKELQAMVATSEESAAVVELDQSKVGRLSRMDAMQAQAMSKETGRRRRQKLLQIDAALQRIEEDDYGYCQECGEDIAPARLEVDPTALLCISCASAKELL